MESRQVIARFEAERQALAMMVHPAIATVFDGGTLKDGRPYFIMEYVKGEPITTYCDRHRVAMRERLVLFQQVCDAVQHAHQKGVIHRDLKPSNVLVTVVDDRVLPKIIDFGVAKAIAQPLTERTLFTELGVLVGTPEYMSPEQAEMGALDIDTRTDVYALGVMLYELLTGSLPLDRSELRQGGIDAIRQMIREREPLKPSTRVSKLGQESTSAARNRHVEPDRLARLLRGDLDWITMKALEKDRTRRYGSASDLAAELARYLRNEPVTAGPPRLTYRLAKLARRHPAGLSAAAAIGLLLAAFAVSMTLQARRIAAERDAVARERERAEQVSSFLVSLFQANDPNVARGTVVTARDLLDRGRSRLDAELKEQPQTRAALLYAIGSAYRALGRATDAVGPLEASLELRRGLQGAQRIDLADTNNELGRVYAAMGRVDDAEARYRDALELRRLVLGPVHLKVAQSLNNLGTIQISRARPAEAEKYFRDAVAMAKRVAAPADVAGLQISLASALSRQGKSREAIEVLEESAAALRRTLGIENTVALNALGNLSRLLFFAGEYGRAETIQKDILDVRRRLLEPGHPDIASSAFVLGETLTNAGRFVEAEALLRESVNIYAKSNQPPNAEHAWGLNGLAWNLFEQDEYEESERRYREALAIFETARDARPADRAYALDGIGDALAGRGQIVQAEQTYRRSIDVRRAAATPAIDLAWAQSPLGRILCEHGRMEEGTALAETALKARTAGMTPGHKLIAQSEAALGSCMAAAKHFDEAESILTRAYTTLSAVNGSRNHDARQAAATLATLYGRRGDAIKAADWRTKGR